MAKVYNVSEARKILGFSYSFIRKLMNDKKITYHQIGRRIWFTESDLISFQESTAVIQ